MTFVGKLISFGMRQVIPDTKIGGIVGDVAGKASEAVAKFVVKHVTDHSRTLPRALERANDRSWQAMSIALAGDGLLDRIKIFFASGDDKGIREQVRLFLNDKNIGFEGSTAEFRKKCLDELKKLKEAGLLKPAKHSFQEFAHQTANFQRYADPKGMIDGAEQVVGEIADELDPHYPNLAKLLRQQPSGNPPLLVVAFAYFFRREVETNPELFNGLAFDGLKQLSANQEKAFAEVERALDSLGDQFDKIFVQLDRIEAFVVETNTVAVETHGAVLDLRVELARIGEMNLTNGDEVRRLMQDVLNLVSQNGMQKGEVRPQYSFSIRSEDERNAVKQLLVSFRQMPTEQQRRVPALLNGLGKLQIGSGDYGGARQTFVAVSEQVIDEKAQAEAHFNVYRAALLEKNWHDALVAIQKAASLDSQRFALFPMQRYEAKSILGAGGFGAAFLCHDRNFDEEVVVKSLHDAAMERSMNDVFREARLLRKLNHPAIIGVHECEFADTDKHVRPYIVMDYFPGGSLENYIQQGNTIVVDDFLQIARQIADGMHAAHLQKILHRDLKPDNVLVQKPGARMWKVKIIDFGLAVIGSKDPTLEDSINGTVKFAPPEQTGDLKGVPPGPYSDVYSFGKMCCYTLFKTTEPKDRHWKTIPEIIRTDLKEMLDQCREDELEHRLPDFGPVLNVLEELADRQRKELQRISEEGDKKLKQLVYESLDRTEGKPTKDDLFAANEICKQYDLGEQYAKFIIETETGAWQRSHTVKPEPQPGEIIPEPQPGEIITNSLGMKFAWIPAGSFLMGSHPTEQKISTPKNPKLNWAERTLTNLFSKATGDKRMQDSIKELVDNVEFQHRVKLSKGFYMSVYPITLGQFSAFVEKSGYKTEAERKNLANPGRNWRSPEFEQTSDHPVVHVSWNDAVAFAKWLAERENKLVRLPTEAEWEYACRAGTTTPFHFGETISTDRANYDGNGVYGNGKLGEYRRKTTPVGSFPSNCWGLYDMHGNVWEWCEDWFGDYPQNDVVDPQGPNTGNVRVRRGGSWFSGPGDCRSACRRNQVFSHRYGEYDGFRVCFFLD